MKQKIPEINRLLSSYLDEFKIIEEKIDTLTGPGEHYGSIILAVDLKLQSIHTGEEKLLNLVAKLIPANEMLRTVFDVSVTFKKEVLAYNTAIPAIVEFQKEYNVPKEKMFDKLFPKCFGARINVNEGSNEVDDTAVLLFDNLKIQGYYTEDRLAGYNVEAVRTVLKDLALFHATPIALKLIKPKVFEEKIKPCLVNHKGLEQVPEIATAFDSAIIEGVKDCPELHSYLEKIQKICDDVSNQPFGDKPPPTEPWSTMSHSDFWTSNSMIQKDQKGRYVNSKIIDLQLTSYSSALSDLVFFLFTSVNNEDLNRYFDEFLRIYYDNFVDNLKDFGVDLEQFSWINFQKELDVEVRSQIYHILLMLKPICTERGVVKNTAENFVDSDWTRKDLLGPNHRRKIKDTVLALVKRKWL